MQANVTKINGTTLDYIHKLEAISKSNAVIEFDDDGMITKVNHIYLEVTGYEPSGLTGTVQTLTQAVLTLELDGSGQVKKANERFLQELGYKRLELSRKQLKELVSEDTVLPVWEEVSGQADQEHAISLISKQGEVYSYQGRFVRVDNFARQIQKTMLVLTSATHN